MYGYNDVTYCVSPNCQNKCNRKLTDEIKAQAQKEWEATGSKTDVLFSCSYFCGRDDESS